MCAVRIDAFSAFQTTSKPTGITEFKRDILGRLIHTLARDSGDKVQETVYWYDLKATSSAQPTAKASPDSTTTQTADSSSNTNGKCRARKRAPETDCPIPTGAIYSDNEVIADIEHDNGLFLIMLPPKNKMLRMGSMCNDD